MNLEKKVVCITNAAMGFSVWFLALTNWSIVGNYTDYIYPIYAYIVAIISRRVLLKDEKKIERKVKLCLLPSRIAGLFQLSFFAMMLIPIFWMPLMFGISEINDEVLIQKEPSPNGMQTAYVYFRPVGAYAPGSGHTYVRVRSILFPFLEHDVFTKSVSGATEETENYITWLSNNSMRISESERGEPTNTNQIRPELPYMLAVPSFLIFLIISLLGSAFHALSALVTNGAHFL